MSKTQFKSDKNFNLNTKTSKAMEKETNAAEQIYNGFAIFLEMMLMFLKMFLAICISIYRKIIPEEEKSVSGEIVLITGCGHGIGKELALQYASLGATVVGWDLNLETCGQTCKEIINSGGPKAFAYQCDVTNRDQVLELAKKVQKEVGDVTVLVNNAGIMPCHPLSEHTPQEIRKIFDINIVAHFWLLEAFLPTMLERNYGHIVALASMAGVNGLRNLIPYCASKFAVRGLMESLFEELRETRPNNEIKLTCICPYMVDTGLCKNPFMRFGSLLKMLSAKDVASEIITAQRRNYMEITIPNYFLTMNYFVRMFPVKCGLLLKDFLSCGVESDKL